MDASGEGDLRLRRTFHQFIEEHLYMDRPEVVILSRILADPINKECDGLHPGIVDTINGKTIRSLQDAKEAFELPSNYDVITLMGNGVPIVLKRSEVLKSTPRILESYRIPSSENLKP